MPIDRIIAKELALDIRRVRSIVKSASHRYFFFQIPKRGGGVRDIYHPARELKALQRWMVLRVINRLPTSSACMAYERGTSIVRNAGAHKNNRFLLRLDLQSFFPSLRAEDVRRLLHSNRNRLATLNLDENDIEMLVAIACREDRLVIGAPSSPKLSNRLMVNFDQDWLLRSSQMGVVYTRYADDMYFSTAAPNVLAAIVPEMRRYLTESRELVLRINERKTFSSSMKRRRLATGLVLTSTGNISVGRDLKRLVKTRIYLADKGNLPADQLRSLPGLVAFVSDVEPQFILSLANYFGLFRLRELNVVRSLPRVDER